MKEKKTKIKKDLFREIRSIRSDSKNTGITLIALVITIVVLLALAAVVVNLSLGENGIINKVKTAVDKYKQAEQNEQIELAKYENEIEKIIDSRDLINKTLGTATEDDIIEGKIAWVNGEKIIGRLNININFPVLAFTIKRNQGGNGNIRINTEAYNNLSIESRTRNATAGTTYWYIKGIKSDENIDEILKSSSPSSSIENFNISNYDYLEIGVNCASVDASDGWAVFYFNNLTISL